MPKAKSKWDRSFLTMLGEKVMQEILNEPRRSLSIDDFFKLKKRFNTKVPNKERHRVRAMERHHRLMDLCYEFTREEKEFLLCMLVPHDLGPEATIGENWKSRTGDTIETVFMNRFEDQQIASLRAYVDSAGKGEVPVGMVVATEVIQKHEKSLAAAMKALEDQKKAARSQKNRIIDVQKKWVKTCTFRADGGASMIVKSIERVLGKKATELFHEGSSTYAEPRVGTLKGIAAAMSDVKPLTQDDIILDLGSGSAASLWQFCQYHGCRGIGIEYAEERLRTAAKMTVKLLNQHGANPTFNQQVINTYGNILELDALPPCSVLYIYDEAFPDNVMEKIFELIDNAPSRLQCIITFKGYKVRSYREDFAACRGVRAISLGNRVYKAFSQEGSGYDLYARNVDDENIVGSNIGNSSIYKTYWDSSLQAKIDYYATLGANLEQKLNRSKRQAAPPDRLTF